MFSQTAAFYDAIYSFKNYEEETARLIEIIGHDGTTHGSELLDVGCGTGLHLAHFKRHFNVQGLDLDENLLQVARTRLPHVALHHGDMTSFDLDHQFDIITCLFGSIGYVKTLERYGSALRCFHKHLKPGGLLLVEPWLSPEGFQDNYLSSLFVDQPALKIARIGLSRKDGSLSVLRFHYLIGTLTGVEQLEEFHELGLFTNEEQMQAFSEAGFTVSLDEAGLNGRGLFVAVKH